MNESESERKENECNNVCMHLYKSQNVIIII